MEDANEMISDSMSDDYIKHSSPKNKSNQSTFESAECSQSVGYSVFPCQHCACFFKSAELLDAHYELEHAQLGEDSSSGKVNKTEKQTSLLHYLREKINIMGNADESEESELREHPVADNLEAANYMYSIQSVAGIQQLYCLMCSFVCDSHDVMQAHFAQKHVKSGLLELLIASTLGNRGNSKFGAFNNKESCPNEKENPRIHHIRKDNKPEYNENEVFACQSCSMKFSSVILLDIHNAQQHKNKESTSLKSYSSPNKNPFTLESEAVSRQPKSKGKIGKTKANPSNALKHSGQDVPSQSKMNSFVSSRLEEVQTRMTKTLILKDSSEEHSNSSLVERQESPEGVRMQNSNTDYNFKTRDKNRSLDPNDDHSEDDGKRLHCQQCNFSTISLKRLQHHNYQKHDQCNQELKTETRKASVMSNDKNSPSYSASTSSQQGNKVFCPSSIHEINHSSSSDLDDADEDEDHDDSDDDDGGTGGIDDSITCKKCFKLVKRCDLKQHNLEVHEIGEGNYECKHCFKRFQLKKHLLTHSKIHEKSSKVRKCKYCAKVCTSTAALSLHLKSKHGDNRPFICKYCGKGFAKSCEQQLHHQTHSGEKSYECNLCGRSFLTKVILNQHLKTHTEDEKKGFHKCSMCSKSFPSRALLETHVHSHNGERPFKCEFCEKVFKTKKLADAHSWTHTREKYFKCEFCPKTFRTSSQAVVHRRGHTSDKPFVCNVCCKAFATSAQIIAHQKTHS